MKNYFEKLIPIATIFGLSTLSSCSPRADSIYASFDQIQSEIDKLKTEQKEFPVESEINKKLIGDLIFIRDTKKIIDNICSSQNPEPQSFGRKSMRQECKESHMRDFTGENVFGTN